MPMYSMGPNTRSTHALSRYARYAAAATRTALVALGDPLELLRGAVLLQPGFTNLERVASVRICIAARVACVEYIAKVLTAGRADQLDLDLAHEFALLVDTY